MAATTFVGVARADSQPPRLDIGAGYPLVLGDGSPQTIYRGWFDTGARVMLNIGDKFAWGVGFDHVWLRNSIAGSHSDDRDGTADVNAHATALDIYLGAAWSPNRSLWSIYGGAGVAWRTFEHVDGLAMAARLSLGASWAYYLDADKRYFLGPNLELSFLTEAASSNLGSVGMFTGDLRLGVVLDRFAATPSATPEGGSNYPMH